ncbi:MAG: hypothetical protein ACYSRZ_09385 [Planctomycetota bacterium]|jgi:hypothetical protein
MTEPEVADFIDNVLCGLWYQWKPRDIEYQGWAAKLRAFEYLPSKNAIREFYLNSDKPGTRPTPKTVIGLLSRTLTTKKNSGMPDTLVFVKCIENPERQRCEGWEIPIYVIINCDEPDYIMRSAESTRRICAENYGGKWITLKKTPFPTDGLVGSDAKEQAQKNIMVGPDTLGKRWLLEQKKELLKKQKKELLKKVPQIDYKAEAQKQKMKLIESESVPF